MQQYFQQWGGQGYAQQYPQGAAGWGQQAVWGNAQGWGQQAQGWNQQGWNQHEWNAQGMPQTGAWGAGAPPAAPSDAQLAPPGGTAPAAPTPQAAWKSGEWPAGPPPGAQLAPPPDAGAPAPLPPDVDK